MAAKLCGDEEEGSEEELNIVRICRTSNGKSLDLSHQKLKTIPSGVLKLSHIQCFYMEDNLLEEIPLQLAENLIQLTWLDVRHNKLKSLPRNISLLTCLKNLLVEGNQIKKLPLELGLLTRLTGLNLKNNPLEFPPKNIIDQGSKTILKYLREQYAISCQMEQLNLQESKCDECEEIRNHRINIEKDSGGSKNPVNFNIVLPSVEDPNSSSDDVEIDIDNNNSNQDNDNINIATLNIGKPKPIESRVAIPKRIQKSLSQPHFSNSIKKTDPISRSHDNIKYNNVRVSSKKEDEKKMTTESCEADFFSSVSVKINKKKVKTKSNKLTSSRKRIRDIMKQTDTSMRSLNDKQNNNNNNVSSDSSSSLKPKVSSAPPGLPISKAHVQDMHQKYLKVGQMVVMNVSPEHHIPGQPCIGEINALPFGKDYMVVHFYTGTFNGRWVPMMSRQSPYLREVKTSDVFRSFQLDSDSCLPRDVVTLLKK